MQQELTDPQEIRLQREAEHDPPSRLRGHSYGMTAHASFSKSAFNININNHILKEFCPKLAWAKLSTSGPSGELDVATGQGIVMAR